MIELANDTTVRVSAVAALIMIAAARAVRSDGHRLSARWLWLPPATVAALVAGTDLSRYVELPRRLDPTTTGLVAATAALAVAAVLVPAPDDGRVDRRERVRPTARLAPDPLATALSAATLGLFLCVPETGLLRALLVPVATMALASFTGLSDPVGRLEAAALTVLLAWVAVADGQSRPPSMVGAAAGLAGIGLRPLGPAPTTGPARPGGPGPWLSTTATMVLAVITVAAARIAGLRPAVESALLAAGIAVASGAMAMLVLRTASTVPMGRVDGPGPDSDGDRDGDRRAGGHGRSGNDRDGGDQEDGR